MRESARTCSKEITLDYAIKVTDFLDTFYKFPAFLTHKTRGQLAAPGHPLSPPQAKVVVYLDFIKLLEELKVFK